MRIIACGGVARLAVCLITYASWTAGPAGCIFGQETLGPRLNIEIIEGDAAVNNVKTRVARETIVEVTDENHKPVAGAIISFTLPNSGPGGTFLNGQRLLTLTTNQSGRASAMLRPNGVQGTFKVNITASFQGLTATTSFAQTNAVAAGAAGAGAGAGGGIGGAIAGHATLLAVVGAAVVATAVAVAKTTGGGGKSARVSVGSISVP